MPDGVTPLRPFASAQEMNEEMVRRWNAKVQPHDKVYVLGDVVINKKFLPILDELNGTKRLVAGNHDIFGTDNYRKYFKEIYACRVLADMILSHIPIHPDSLTTRFGTNVHGHLHAHEVTIEVPVRIENNIMFGPTAIVERVYDPRYMCVSVEHVDYAPISLEEAREKIKARQEAAGYEPPKAWGNGSGAM
jgi:calcineurin-like phosphoesterase family protein